MEKGVKCNKKQACQTCKKCQVCQKCQEYKNHTKRPHCTLQTCGTLDMGCPQPAVSYIDDSMCSGVFALVCSPEVCNVPRAPHHEVLVEGQGTILDEESGREMTFTILIERTMQVYSGKFMLNDSNGSHLEVSELNYFSQHEDHFALALFYDMSEHRHIMVTISKNHQVAMSEKLYVYSSPAERLPMNLGGKLTSGEIEIYMDHNVHEH